MKRDTKPPKKLIDRILEYVTDVWIKFLIQAVLTGLFYLFYKIIGKKDRANDRVSKLIDTIFYLAPTKEDTFLQSIRKSNEIYRSLAIPSLGNSEKAMKAFFEVLKSSQSDEEKPYVLHKDRYFVSVIVNAMLKRKFYFSFKTVEVSSLKDSYFNYEIFEVAFEDGEKLYILQEHYPWGAEFSNYYISNINQKEKTQTFLKSIGKFVFVDYSAKERTFVLSAVKHENAMKDSEENPFLLHPKIEKVLDQEFALRDSASIQRSVLLLGPPGRGKTGGVYEFARRRDKTVLKFDASIIELAGSELVSDLFQYSETDIVLLDEIDRIIVGNQDEKISRFLYSLEAFKSYPNNPIVIATANTLKNVTEAALRPGRLESVVLLEAPTAEEQEEFCTMYAKTIGYEFPTPELKQDFLKATSGFTEAFLKDWIIQLKSGISIPTIGSQIELRKKVTAS